MNRTELLFLTLIIFAAIVVLLKSRWFDRFIDSLMRGSRPVDADALKQDKSRFEEAKQKATVAANEAEARAVKQKEDLKSL